MDPSGNDNNSSRDGSNRISTLSKAELQVGYNYFSDIFCLLPLSICIFVFLVFVSQVGQLGRQSSGLHRDDAFCLHAKV